MIEENYSTFEGTEWDSTIEDVTNVMKNEWPDHVIRTKKCLRSLAMNKIEPTDKEAIKRYARNYKLNEDKILLMY